eukprot:CAMPEP_0119563720 /NCGR_PEP_ID=MMETSP1352-20130426/24465_1 /TAXON_ID=265584 /ORGANISM="Stauroneis constricta, Strain CCMP1120" /LENGTH=163 /DNA_ID=CAMNT_0007612365 /DNA_START=65 /DNA_END=553 /DNA_ORIENTATION=-
MKTLQIVVLSIGLLLSLTHGFVVVNVVQQRPTTATRPTSFVMPSSSSLLMATPAATDGEEKAWRHAKRALLRIGAKGATKTHGNSLRQLLEDHTIVKVKVDPKPFDGSLENAFTQLRDLAVESGASKDIELIQWRDSDRMILFGLPGTMDRIQSGDFPPPPPP